MTATALAENLPKDFPPLERECPVCNGRPYRGKCSHCDGHGLVPTDFGQAVLNLVARHLPAVDRAIENHRPN